jgi:hypothetical protein
MKILDHHQIMPQMVPDRIIDVPSIVRNVGATVVGLREGSNTSDLARSEFIEVEGSRGIRRNIRKIKTVIFRNKIPPINVPGLEQTFLLFSGSLDPQKMMRTGKSATMHVIKICSIG